MKYGETITVIPYLQYEGPVCPCGNYLCRPADDPYCPRSAVYCGSRGAGNYGGVPARAAASSLSEEYRREFDSRAAYIKAEAKRRVQEGDGSIEGAEGRTHVPHSVKLRGASDLDSQSHSRRTAEPQATPPKRKRRTKQEMAEFRASKQRQIQDSYESLVPAETREWLDASDPLVDQILAAPHEKD